MSHARPRSAAVAVCDRLFIVPIVVGVVVGIVLFFGSTPSGDATAATTPPDMGTELFRGQCSSCHGLDGRGVGGRGPSLEHEGAAAADFVLRTGRMPLAAPDLQATRGPVRYTEAQILALVDHVASIGDGPSIPRVATSGADVAAGGRLYRLNCAACHVASGAGAPIGSGQQAPSLADATATQVGEAIIVGPGAMPVFGSLQPDQVNDIAAYVALLQRDDTTAATSFGGAGPVAEGLAAWILALIPLVALTRWIGSPKAGRDHPEGGGRSSVLALAGEPAQATIDGRAAIIGNSATIGNTRSNLPPDASAGENTKKRGALLIVAGLALVNWFNQRRRSDEHHE